MKRPLNVPKPRPIFVQGMFGLGDNIMQRPFIRAAAAREDRVYLQTPWPELYADLENVLPVRSMTRLRTQAKSERAWRGRWHSRPHGVRTVRMAYLPDDLARGSIQQAMERRLPLGEHPFVWDLPTVGRAPEIDTGGRPLAIVRPVTERAEWHNPARNPLPEYVCQIAEALAATHHVICVADLEPGREWLVGPMPVCDQAFMRGEISSMDLLELIRRADVVVGGVGFIVPACLAVGTPLFCVLGGQGGHNAPSVVVDPRADASRLGWAIPARYCQCGQKTHKCDKTIDGVLEQFGAWARSTGVIDAAGSVRRGRRAATVV